MNGSMKTNGFYKTILMVSPNQKVVIIKNVNNYFTVLMVWLHTMKHGHLSTEIVIYIDLKFALREKLSNEQDS